MGLTTTPGVITVVEAASALRRLLPPGVAWAAPDGSRLWQYCRALGTRLVAVHQRTLDMISESDPRTAVESLPEWEAMLGLPATGTTAQRQSAVTAAWVARGGQTPAYFVALASSGGWTITITEHVGEELRCGVAQCGDEMASEAGSYTWEVTGPVAAQAILEPIITRQKPVHTNVVFTWV